MLYELMFKRRANVVAVILMMPQHFCPTLVQQCVFSVFLKLVTLPKMQDTAVTTLCCNSKCCQKKQSFSVQLTLVTHGFVYTSKMFFFVHSMQGKPSTAGKQPKKGKKCSLVKFKSAQLQSESGGTQQHATCSHSICQRY